MKLRTLLITVSAYLVTFGCIPSVAQTEMGHLSVTGPRPVAKAIDLLEKKYGWVITYEDPAYANQADIVDITARYAKNGKTPPRKVLVPRGGTLQLDYPVEKGMPAEDVPHLLTRMLNAYGTGNHPRFRVEQQGKHWNVIPTEVLNEGGELAPTTPILDTVISIPAGKRSTLGMIQAICDEVNRVAGSRIGLGTGPTNYRDMKERGAVDQQPARDVLRDVLNRSLPDFSWSLFYDPGFERYVLNIYGVATTNPPLKTAVTAAGQAR